MRAARRSRQTGTSAPNAKARSAIGKSVFQARLNPQTGRGVRGAAADAGGDGQVFLQAQPSAGHNSGLCRQATRRAQHQIIGLRRQPAREWAGELQRQRAAGRVAQPVAHRRKYRQAVQQMVAILPLAGDMQVQIYLGRRKTAQH
jgi:hypothetical protein